MKKTVIWGAHALAMLALVCLSACDDGTPSGPMADGQVDTGPGDMGAGGADMGGGGPCLDDAECADDEYCRINEGDFSGQCLAGCREGSCPAGEECDLEERICRTPPCTGSADCPTGQFCNDADPRACEDGCRPEDESSCPTVDEDGRPVACDPDSNQCVTLAVCCSDADECSMVADAGACEGEALPSALSCDQNPCGDRCPGGDADCVGEQFCNDDGRCQDGCRLEAGACPPGLACNVVSHVCEEQPCAGSDECQGYQACDEAALVCTDGCRDGGCPMGQECIDLECIERCDPAEVGVCGDGRYCDVNREECRDNCDGHDDCDDGEACNFLTNECEVDGCRDDETEAVNNALGDDNPEIRLGAPDEDGFRTGEAEGVLCGDDADFFQVTVGQGERMRVRLIFDEAENLDMRLHGDAVGDDPIEAAGFEVPEVITFPDAGVVNNETTYFIEVFGAGEGGVEYTVSVTIAPAESPCFPDDLEQDDEPEDATNVGGNNLFERRDLNICIPNDADWFSRPLLLNDGLRVEVITGAGEAPMTIALFSESRLGGVGGGGPNHQDVVAEDRAGRVAYVLEVPAQAGGFSDEDWFIRINSSDPRGFPDYDLRITRDGVEQCMDDNYEENDAVADGVDLDNLADVSVGGQVPYADDFSQVPEDEGPLVVCTFDDDYYCLDLDAGDGFEAYAIGDGVAGQVDVRIVDDRGVNVGRQARLTDGMEPNDLASIRGALEGRYCVVVDGLAAAAGPYELFVRRFEIDGGDCGADPELVEGANNTPSRPTAMEDVGPDDRPGQRFSYQGALMCGAEVDWYSFPVASPRSRVCVQVDGFRNALRDIEVEAYHDRPDENPDNACMGAAQCDGGAQCIRGFCQAAAADSRTPFDAEVIDLNPLVVGNRNGAWLAHVLADGAGVPAPYNITATVTPQDPNDCAPDWQEVGNPNDRVDTATPLGAGQAGFCDAWVCETDNNVDQDWYSVVVPPGEDRTVLIQYASNADGRLFLDYEGAEVEDPNNGFGGFRRSADPVGNYQCINLRGGADEHTVHFRVFSNLRRDDGDLRVDYSMRVVPTDMAGIVAGGGAAQYQDHQGECLRLGAGELGTCPLEDPFADGCWPFVILP